MVTVEHKETNTIIILLKELAIGYLYNVIWNGIEIISPYNLLEVL
jgi:hypothetical protein